jgi:Lycopene cyclase protein
MLLFITGYSVVRSLSEAPKYASVIASILKKSSNYRNNLALQNTNTPSMLGEKNPPNFNSIISIQFCSRELM